MLPLGLFGLWLTGTAERSAEALLRTRLDSSMGRVVDQIGSHWINERSRLLDFCESPSVQGELREEEPTPGASSCLTRRQAAIPSIRPSIQTDN